MKCASSPISENADSFIKIAIAARHCGDIEGNRRLSACYTQPHRPLSLGLDARNFQKHSGGSSLEFVS
jgi:hypothetical protein